MKYDNLIADAATRYGIPHNILTGLVSAESGGNPSAVSPKGAVGLTQIMPATAQELGVDPRDPVQAIDGGARYLRQQYDQFGNWASALAAYNAGPGRVAKAGGTIPNIRETQQYVGKVMGDDSDIFGSPAPGKAAGGQDDMDIFADIARTPAKPTPARSTAGLPKLSPEYQNARKALASHIEPRGKTAVMNGVLAGYYDDLNAAGEAGLTAIKNLALDAMGKPKPYGARDAYKATMDMYQEQRDQFGKEHPIAAPAMGMEAAAMVPVGGALRGASLGGAMLRGGLFGAGYGGLSAAGNARGDVGERLEKVPGGMALGAAAGVALPPIAAGAGRLAAPVVQRLAATPLGQATAARIAAFTGRPAPQPVPRPMPKPEARVAGAINNAIQRDFQQGPAVAAQAMQNPTAPAFLAGGDNLLTLAEMSAQSPGPGKAVVSRAVRDYTAGAGDRVKSRIASDMGGQNNYFETLDKLGAERATKAREGMANIGEHLVTLDDNSVSALRSDLSRSAIKSAADNALASPDPDVRAAGAALNRLHDQLLDKPSAVTVPVRQAQDISKALLSGADTAFKSGDGARGTALKGLGKAVRENARTPERGGFKEYDDWLKTYGDDAEHMEALELGRTIFNGGLDNTAEKVGRTLGDMSDASKDFYRKGVAEAVLGQARQKGGVPAMRQLLKSEEFGDKVKLAFRGDDAGFKRFMDAMEQEVVAQGKANQVVSNSRTFARSAAAEDLAAQGVDPLDAAAGLAEVAINPRGAAAKGIRAGLKALPRKDRSIIGDPQMNELLARGVTDPNELSRLLQSLQAQRGIRTGAARLARDRSGMLTLPMIAAAQNRQ